MNLKVTQVIGLNTDQKAAQVTSITSGDNTFLAVLDLSSDDAFTRGRQVLSETADFYFDFDGTPAEKINATFEKVKEDFLKEEFSILLAAVSGKILYLTSKGEMEVYLKRADKLSPLLSVGADSQLISGFLQEGDRVLFSTKSLVNFLGSDLEKSLSLPLETFEEEVTDRIGASNLENQGLAALVLEIERQNLEPEGGTTLKIDREEIPPVQDPLDDSYAPSFSLKKTAGVVFHRIGKLRDYFPKSGRGRLILAVILIAVLGLGVAFKVKSSQDAQKQAAFNESLQGAKDDFNAAKGLTTLNPSEAKVKLDTVKEKINKALSLKPNDAEAQNLKKQLEDESGSILKQSTVSEFPLFLDMDLVKKNFRSQNLSLSGEKIILLDPAVETLVIIDIGKKSQQILAGSEQLGDAVNASLNGGLAFVYSEDKGVLRVDTTNQKVTEVAKKDTALGKIADIYGFAGNVYLLDAEKNQIWKYLPTSSGYSDKREYLTKGTKVDFSNALRMQIESSVYVLKNGGEILRFTRGDKDNFGLEGLDKGVKDPKSFFVSSDTENLYVLDSGNLRLLILTKTGSFKGQISGDKFGSATDLVVDEKGKKVYLLEGSKIFTVDLK